MKLIRLTPLTYSICVASIILLFLSISEIVLEAHVLHAFRNFRIQYPGSRIVEWLFVPLNPQNLDSGPTNGIITTGACGLVSAIFGMGWVMVTWRGAKENRIQKLGVATCLLASVNTAVTIAVIVYVYVTEAQNQLPAYFVRWQNTTFTREYYICTAFPSLFQQPEVFYGSACDIARAARYVLIGSCCVSVVLTGLVVLQAHKAGAFRRSTRKTHDLENGIKKEKSVLKSNGLPRHRYPMAPVPSLGTKSVTSDTNARVERPAACVKVDRTSMHGYYSKL